MLIKRLGPNELQVTFTLDPDASGKDEIATFIRAMKEHYHQCAEVKARHRTYGQLLMAQAIRDLPIIHSLLEGLKDVGFLSRE